MDLGDVLTHVAFVMILSAFVYLSIDFTIQNSIEDGRMTYEPIWVLNSMLFGGIFRMAIFFHDKSRKEALDKWQKNKPTP